MERPDEGVSVKSLPLAGRHTEVVPQPTRLDGDDMEASFVRAWGEAESIPGWLNRDEARHLYRAACSVPRGQVVVEIGAYQGKSAVLLAHTGRRVITIDPMEVGDDLANRMSITEDDVRQLELRLSKHLNISWLRAKSTECNLPAERIGLLYIDGSHQYPHPRAEFEHFRRGLADGAAVAFHDYGTFDGVTKSVRELESSSDLFAASIRDSMYIARCRTLSRPVEDVTAGTRPSVKGFHLFALCHRFGLRGRAFARSLACQQSPTYRLHVTVYYCTPVDAQLFMEGVHSGPRPPTVTLVSVPAERIMQRAVHFSQALCDDSCSHVVFLDADLWFPPEFWKDYGDCLASQQPGYWSARVYNISQEDAGDMVGRWHGLEHSEFETRRGDVRHNQYYGKVGHFQCIPRDLVRYPADGIHAVNRADETFAAMALDLSLDARHERRIGNVPVYHLDHPRCWTGASQQF